MKNLLFIFLIYFTIGCNSNSNSQESNISQKVEVIEKVEFDSILSTSENYLLIDVRTKSEFNLGAIPGAINSDFLNGDFQSFIKSLDKSKPIMVYCAVGGRSGKARELLKSEGFQIIYDLKGGYNSWSK